MATRELQSPTLLKAVSYPESVRDTKLDDYIRRLALQLPYGGDERSRQLAKRLRAEANSPEAYIRAVLNRYRERPFHYTLRPPTLGSKDTIDAFLFDTQRGFCAHYAGSFVYLMRAAGIPARVVAGYQGGEWSAAGKYLLVHQYDAHAWTEVWLENRGWVRIDPTTMVAPSRTEHGLEEAMRTEGSFLENDLFSTRKIAWLNDLRKQLDSVQYGWRRFVLGYSNESQSDLLESWFGQLTLRKMMIILSSLFGAIGLLWVFVLGLNRQKVKTPPEQLVYQKFCKLLEKKGVPLTTGQAPGDLARFAAHRLPDHANNIMAINASFEQLYYMLQSDKTKAALLNDIKGKIRKLGA